MGQELPLAKSGPGLNLATKMLGQWLERFFAGVEVSEGS